MTCAPELEELAKLSALSNPSDLEIVSVAALDTPESIKRFLKTKHFPFKMIEDSDGTLAEKYQIVELPVTLIFDGQGNPLKLFDPVTETYATRITGARSWVSQSMSHSISEALTRSGE